MRPVQVWLPFFKAALSDPEVDRDARRAFELWTNEARVWLLPGLERPTRWHEDWSPLPILAVPAEHFDQLDVYHVDAGGHVWGPDLAERFPGGTADGVLLRALRADPPELCLPSPTRLVTAPKVRDGRAIVENGAALYETITLAQAPGPLIPWSLDRSPGAAPGSVHMTWPPRGSVLRSVAPEAESKLMFGVPSLVAGEGSLRAVSPLDPAMVGLCVLLRWAAPLDVLFSEDSGLDEIQHLARLASVARASGEDAMGALRRAREYASPYLTTSTSTVECVHMLPAIASSGRGRAAEASGNPIHEAVWTRAEALRLLERAPEHAERRDLAAAYESAASRIEVRRAWGGQGLLWALLLDALEGSRPFKSCDLCGHVFSGTRRKRRCGRHDNRACYRDQQKRWQASCRSPT